MGFEVAFLSELGKFDGLKSEVSNEYESHASFLYGKKIAQKVVGVSINKKNDETWQWAQPCIVGKSNEPTKTIYYYAFQTLTPSWRIGNGKHPSDGNHRGRCETEASLPDISICD